MKIFLPSAFYLSIENLPNSNDEETLVVTLHINTNNHLPTCAHSLCCGKFLIEVLKFYETKNNIHAITFTVSLRYVSEYVDSGQISVMNS